MEKEINRCPNCRTELRFDRTAYRKIKCPRCNYLGPASKFPVVVKRKCVCPACHKGVFIADDVKSPVKCPHCGSLNGRDAYHSAQAPVPHPDDNNPTRVIDINNCRPGVLVVTSDGNFWRGARTPIQLHNGINRIGRASQSVHVEVPLPTDDPQMSRCHAMIKMEQKPNGEILHFLEDANSKNGTYCRNQLLSRGDSVVLTKGDIIRLGNTELMFDMI